MAQGEWRPVMKEEFHLRHGRADDRAAAQRFGESSLRPHGFVRDGTAGKLGATQRIAPRRSH
ncbi:hypothetical protein IP95_01140 [Extensimonas vulgaris]|uniref:Uncharacterized protein n=1 Tax=Extensimonas vulgaris TaxID=1031594 RepID=A0A369APP2_9BURK|nr:hypothetical protein DFR45_103295 [Extensimonas vulgaris]TWI39906.1 hypothetical protein IP95_01140 [Extensimonas vulgaris]